MPACRNNGSTVRSSSRITGPIRRRSTSHCRAPGSQTPPALRISSSYCCGHRTITQPTPSVPNTTGPMLGAHPQRVDPARTVRPTRADLPAIGSSLPYPRLDRTKVGKPGPMPRSPRNMRWRWRTPSISSRACLQTVTTPASHPKHAASAPSPSAPQPAARAPRRPARLPPCRAPRS
jgi:hypothetical protein